MSWLFALEFNGNQWAEVPHKTLLQSVNNFTVAMWFNTGTVSTKEILISKRFSDTNISFQIAILGGGKIE